MCTWCWTYSRCWSLVLRLSVAAASADTPRLHNPERHISKLQFVPPPPRMLTITSGFFAEDSCALQTAAVTHRYLRGFFGSDPRVGTTVRQCLFRPNLTAPTPVDLHFNEYLHLLLVGPYAQSRDGLNLDATPRLCVLFGNEGTYMEWTWFRESATMECSRLL